MILDNNPSFYDGGVTDIPDMSREDASTVLNAARSSCLQRFGKRKQGDDINNSQSMDSCNSKRQWKYDSLSTNDNASDDKICNDSVAAAPNSQSAEPHLGEVDVPEEGNATLEGSQQTYNKEVTDSATQASDNSMLPAVVQISLISRSSGMRICLQLVRSGPFMMNLMPCQDFMLK
jgi:hypothetical protein